MFFPALFLLAADLENQVKQFVGVFAAVEANAAERVDASKAFYEGAIPGMLRRLDPHSVFFDPMQFEQLKELEKSTRKGFGSVVSVLPGRVIVLQTLSGTPSAKAGLAPGDEIVAINGIPLNRLDMEQLIGLLTESRQRPARLDVRRGGRTGLLAFEMVPEEMQSASVDRAFLLRPGLGYLRVSSFDAQTGAQIRRAIERLGGPGLRGLLLDLRNNPGGLLPAALETAALFLKPGQLVLSVKGRAVTGEEVKVPEKSQPYTFPVAVLINGKSASASEIVAGALQDHDRATIVGEPSFGKGLVESVFPLSQGTALALTTAYYYTPSGRSIQRPLTLSQAQPAAPGEFRTDSGRPVKAGGGIQPDIIAFPEFPSRLRIALDASGSLTSFATEFLKKEAKVDAKFEVTAAILDEFQVFASQRGISPGVAEWSGEREWIRYRLKTEILNQALGVEKGDEVEAQRDPVIVAALKALGLAQ
jgi:carboxyl-terminal processing protease